MMPPQTSSSQLFPCGGVDGAKGGWALCWKDSAETPVKTALLPDALAVWKLRPWRSLWWDMPIGLPHPGMPRRQADLLARQLLPPSIRSRVFLAPCRSAVEEGWLPEWRLGHPQASDLNRRDTGLGLSLQAYHLIPKIRELDLLHRQNPSALTIIRESHPELVFASLNQGNAVIPSKKSPEGKSTRLRLLATYFGYDLSPPTIIGSKPDDWVDALALLASAQAAGSPLSLPVKPEKDEHGIPCAVWIPAAGGGA